MAADGTHCRSMFVGIIICNLLQTGGQFGTMAIERHDVGKMGRQLVCYQHFAPASFIQYGYLYPITELRHTVHQQDIYILNKSIMPYFIVGNIVLDIFNTAIIPHCHIM